MQNFIKLLLDLLAEFLGAFTRPLEKAPSAPEAPGRMRTKNIDHIRQWEALRLTAYMPTPNDVWTIGYGHTGSAKKGMVITERQAEDLLRKDLRWVENTIHDLVKVPLTQLQFDALASFIFNIGRTQFARSTMLRKLNAYDYAGAANEFLRWDKQAGKTLRGLTRRREDERQMFIKGTPK